MVVLDPADRGLLMRTFNDLLGLPGGTLTGVESGRQNRSMSAAETELFRRLNVQLRDRDFPWKDYADLIRYGSILRTVELMPSGEGPAVHTPDWAVDRAVELARGYREIIEELRVSGLDVIGDPDLLTEPWPGAPEPTPAPDAVPVDLAVQAILGAVSRAGTGNAFFPDEVARGVGEQEGLPGSQRTEKEVVRIEDLSAREISEVLAGRVRRGVGRRYRSQRRRLQRLASRSPLTPAQRLEALDDEMGSSDSPLPVD
ncbi:DNA-directed RNA polymerase specialized sigma24 family protein [Kineosporia succinea]|uniref:DNA-directed RNA polymerase specialized sigma24 family protein n=1 Tax=Kineosporia succinea TaxID=84632 RepID=A0ABT9NVD8_9ACTN|nr:DNA-directed RNA polymerase specialized sigma24 family protein [Kineosporia succinea]